MDKSQSSLLAFILVFALLIASCQGMAPQEVSDAAVEAVRTGDDRRIWQSA